MTIFSEIYGVYFRIVSKLMQKETLTENDVNEAVKKMGFRDSVLFLPQMLIPQKDGSDWKLFSVNYDGTLSRIIKNPPRNIMTKLQKMWLKSKLSDPRMRLFLDDSTLSSLELRLADVKPLYLPEHFRYTDRFEDGDDYAGEKYRENFREILKAVKTKEILGIAFTSGHNRRINRNFLPIKIEYSSKNDKFRVHCRLVKQGRFTDSIIINIGRIEKITSTGCFCRASVNMQEHFSKRRCREPVTVCVTNERNAVERFFMEFAPYEKHSERDLATGNCTVKLWYDKQDETELLIRLLSFGPVIEILGPPAFRRQAAERVMKQAELISGREK